MNRVCRVAGFLLLASAVPVLGQQPAVEPATLRGDSTQTRERLNEAAKKLAANQTADAIDALQRILDDASDDLVSADGKQYRPARRFAQQLLTKLPADALKSYQDRLDGPARKLLDAAKKTRDPVPLWTLLDRYAVSRPAEEGLLLLGELLFEQGDFLVAEQIWRRLLPDGGADLAHPNPKTDPAIIRARMILAALFAGDVDRAKATLAEFKAKHPNAKGTLAGKDGAYAEILQAFLDKPPTFPVAANPGRDWPTFGGGPDRAGRVGVRLPRYWPTGRPTWNEILAPPPRHHKAPPLPPVRPSLGHPVIANDRVFVTEGTRLFGFELLTGRPLAIPEKLADPVAMDAEKPVPDGCPSLTAFGDRLYMRVGPSVVKQPDLSKGKAQEETAIVCLGPGTTTDMRELWRLTPPGAGKTPVVWEGAPLVSGRRLWAVHARFEGGRVVHGIECYDPADAISAPTPVWSVDVCDSPMSMNTDPRGRQELLTLAGRNVVFCSNTGAVVSLDAATGKRAWGFRYPRSRKADSNRSSDPSPAVFSCGRVFVAPADANRVYALDPESGRVLWESGSTEGAQILGVTNGKLIVTVTGPIGGLRAMSVITGSQREPEGWVLHDTRGLLSYGQGFVTDDVIVWPTRGGLCFLSPQDGRLLAPPFQNHLTGEQRRYFGNVVYAAGVLVVVTPTQIWGYVSEARRFSERTDRDPIRAKFETLIEKAEDALAVGSRRIAQESLLAASGNEFPNSLRAWAAGRLLLLFPRTDAEDKLPPDVRTALAPELREEWLIAPDGALLTLGSLVLRHTGREPAPAFLPTSPTLEGDRNFEAAPTLPADAEISRTLRLPVGSVPLRWLPGMASTPKRLFTTSTAGLLAASLTHGEDTRHDSAGHFTHAADIHDGFVAVGPLVVAVYASGRAPAWVFRVPTTEPLPARAGEFRLSTDFEPQIAELNSFRLTGSWLIARLGERHLIALDLKGKRVAWVLGTNGKHGFQPRGFPDAIRFGPTFSATDRLIVVQLSDGRRLFVRAQTGKILEIPGFEHPGAKVWWALPPAEVETNRLAISDGPGLVRMLNLVTGRVKWTHLEDREASLAGTPPQVRAWGENIFLAVRRNHGVELDRLDMSDGQSAWKGNTAFLDADCMNLANADADTERIYLPAGNTLAAFNMKDGKSAWEAELPNTRGSGGWVVKAGQRCVIVYPETAIPREALGGVLTRTVRSFWRAPQSWRLPGLLAGLYDAWVTRSVPVLLFDPDTGKRLNAFLLPAAGSAVTTWFERDLAVVATGDRVCWLK